MEHKPKALSPATQPVAQPAPVVQKPKKTKLPPLDTLTLEQAEALATQRGHGKPKQTAQAQAQAQAEGNALADAQAQNEREFAKSQRAMRRQPKHIQALGRQLWKLWG